jgi:predicted S18 family serine protease
LLVVLSLPTASFAQETAPAAGGSRIMEALWYREGEPGKPRVFGVTQIRATAAPNPEREVRVGVFEEYAGATGAQWRSSIWVASFIGSLLLGRDLTQHRFDISAGGYIDGPSAGALMAVGFIAAMTGDGILPEATMTGALAPDGTVGPVGGIPEKIEAAKAVGKKVVGIPAGQAVSAGADGKAVDVVELGRGYGIEVREVADVYDAYQLLTGKALPRPTPVGPPKMAVPAALAAKLKERAQAMLQQAAKDIQLASQSNAPGVARAVTRAKRELRAVRHYLQRGDKSAAYLRAIRAVSMAKAATRVASLSGEEKFQQSAGSLDDTEAEIQKVEKALDAIQKDARTKPLLLFAAFGTVARARGFLELARAVLASSIAATRAKGIRALQAIQRKGQGFLPALYLSYADVSVDFARDVLKGGGELDTPLKLDEAALARAARGYVSAASGNMEYIDALLLSEIAQERKVPLDVIRNNFGRNERAYLLAAQLSQMAIEKATEAGAPTVASSLMRLESAAHSYVESASIITKYYSLDAGVPAENQRAEVVRLVRALAALLKRAELGAREAAAIAEQRLGVIPPHAQFYYRAAVQELAYGTPRAKLRALRDFWRSSVASRAAAMVLSKEAESAPGATR